MPSYLVKGLHSDSFCLFCGSYVSTINFSISVLSALGEGHYYLFPLLTTLLRMWPFAVGWLVFLCLVKDLRDTLISPI